MGGGGWGQLGGSSFVCHQKSPESHRNPAVFLLESDDKRISGAFSAANTGPLVEARAGGGGEMPLAAINFQLRRRGTKQSSSPLRRLFQFVPRLNARRRLPTCSLKLIIGSGKLAYLRLALWLTGESHKHKQKRGGGGFAVKERKKEKKRCPRSSQWAETAAQRRVFLSLFFKRD